jgi:hypothetical protein
MARGRLAANLTLEMHLRDNDNVYPETVAVSFLSLSWFCLLAWDPRDWGVGGTVGN